MKALEKAHRESALEARRILNPGEQVIWEGYCLSKVGKQAKSGRGPDQSIGSCLFLLVCWGSAFIGVLALTGTGLGLLLIFPLAILIPWMQSKLHAPDSSMYCRKQTIYVLTDQRAFILRKCNTEAPVISLPLRFVDVVRSEGIRPDGKGNVQFLRWDRQSRQWTFPLRFHMVERPEMVAHRIQTMLADRRSGDDLASAEE